MKQLLFILSIITFLSCTKAEPDPEPPKPNEADTMRALINGEEWSAYCESSWPGLGCTKVTCRYYDDTKGFEISTAGGHYSMNFAKSGGQGGIQLGINELPFKRTVIICHAPNCLDSKCRTFEMDTTNINTVDITDINKEYRIIEGTFEFRVVNKECSDTIIVTEGYFRTNY